MHATKLSFIPRILMVPKPTRSDFCAGVCLDISGFELPNLDKINIFVSNV